MTKKITTPARSGEATDKHGLINTMAAMYNLQPEMFLSTIRNTIMPGGATNEQMALFLLICRERGLSPLSGEVHALPKKGGGICAYISIDGWIRLLNDQPDFDGIEFDYLDDDRGEPLACVCRIYRKGRSRPIEVTEYFAECARASDPWHKAPRRMLRHKATIQCIRLAYGSGGLTDEDDARIAAGGAIDILPTGPNAQYDPLAAPSTGADPEPVVVLSAAQVPEPEPENSTEVPEPETAPAE